MNLKKAQQLMEKEIESLEQGTYIFETVAKKRYEADKEILRNLKDQYVKLVSLAEKVNAGQEVTQSEIHEAVPAAFR